MIKIFRLTAAIIFVPLILSAETQVSGYLDMIAKNSGNDDITNITFKGFSNFHSIRTRLLFDSQVEDRVTVFAQILLDDNTFSVYGAYARISKIAGKYLNANVGFIPTTVGAFVSREYSDKNPLIGQPLMYIHHSNYVPGRPDSIQTVDDLLATRDNRSKYGIPVIYDACWNTGAELYGSVGKLDYSLGALAGSVGYPNMEQYKDIPQMTTHLNYYFSPSFSVGGSAFFGPYLFNGAYADGLPYKAGYSDTTGTPDEDDLESPTKYLNTGLAGELHFTHGYLEILAEGVYSNWDHPVLPDLSITAGYIEATYKFAPGWYVAGRFDRWQPNKLKDSAGVSRHWDYPVQRVEFGLGYHPFRRVTTKLVAQINRFDQTDLFDNEIYALQFGVAF